MVKRWASTLPVMQGGALLVRSAADGLFYASGWGGLDDEDLHNLVVRGRVRAIGDAYGLSPAPPGPMTPLPASCPAITVWQPWATLIAEQAKPWEFRGYRAPASYVGRRVAIHAGARPLKIPEVKMLLVQVQSGRAARTGLAPEAATLVLEAMLRAPALVISRAVVCTAVLGEPIRSDVLARDLGVDDMLRDSDRGAHSNWAWPMLQVERLAFPAPATGKQGWWRWQPT